VGAAVVGAAVVGAAVVGAAVRGKQHACVCVERHNMNVRVSKHVQ
jgi:hypothetical protein